MAKSGSPSQHAVRRETPRLSPALARLPEVGSASAPRPTAACG